ncbi:hypothetical protein KA012_04265 [Candidatus Woesebacteria bacterium]|nr:hypothetical protein [Candidatus Woesebacteria bacterium]
MSQLREELIQYSEPAWAGDMGPQAKDWDKSVLPFLLDCYKLNGVVARVDAQFQDRAPYSPEPYSLP